MSTKKKKLQDKDIKETIPEFTIEKGVPLSGRISLKYPLDQMESGDSFEFPIGRRASVAQKARKFGKGTGATFAIRKVDDEKGRIWRVQ